MQVSIVVESLMVSMNTISEEGDAFVLVKYGDTTKGEEVGLFKDAKSGMWGAHVGGVYGLEYASTPELAWKDALRQYAEIYILEGEDDAEDDEWEFEDDDEEEWELESRLLRALDFRDDFRDYSSEG